MSDWASVEMTPEVRALVKREREIARAEDALHDAVRNLRLARQALGDVIVPLGLVHQVEQIADRVGRMSREVTDA